MTRKPAAEPLYPRAVRLSQADQLRLERLASAMGCSGSEAIRRAVREALERRLDRGYMDEVEEAKVATIRALRSKP